MQPKTNCKNCGKETNILARPRLCRDCHKQWYGDIKHPKDYHMGLEFALERIDLIERKTLILDEMARTRRLINEDFCDE